MELSTSGPPPLHHHQQQHTQHKTYPLNLTDIDYLLQEHKTACHVLQRAIISFQISLTIKIDFFD